MTQKTEKIFRIVTAVYFAAVLYLCFGKFDNLPGKDLLIFGIAPDKVVHFLMFFPLPLLMYLSYSHLSKKPLQGVLFSLVAFVVGALFAAGTELVQGMTTYRSADPMDFRTDAIALALSSILIIIIDLGKQFKK